MKREGKFWYMNHEELMPLLRTHLAVNEMLSE